MSGQKTYLFKVAFSFQKLSVFAPLFSVFFIPCFDELPPPYLNDYKRIVERYLQSQSDNLPTYSDEEIKEILVKAATEKPPPSLQSVFRKIGCRSTGYRYIRRFPEICEKISNRYNQANRKMFDIEKAETVLKSALKEHPMPSFSEIAQRLNCKRETLDKKLPTLSEKLPRKYVGYVEKSRVRNKPELY